MLLLVSHRSEVDLLEPLVVLVGELLIVLDIPRLLTDLDRLIGLFQLKSVIGGELDGSLSLLVVDDDQDLLLAQAAQFDGFLKKTPLSFAKSYVSLHFVVDQLELVDFLLSHVSYI